MTATTERGTAAGPAGLTPRQIMLVFIGLMLAMLLAALDQTIVNTALPTIAGDLHGLDELPWVLTAYLLTSTVGLLIYGKLGDQFGRKGVFMFAIVIFLVGSTLAGLSQTMTQLIAFCALQGVGGGGLMISAQAIIGDIVSPRERGKYMGFMGGVFGISTIAGPLLGGFFTDHASWRWCFYVNLPIGVIALAVTAVVLHLPKRDRSRKPRLDIVGAALMAGASTCLVLFTTWGGTKYAWSSTVIMCLGAGFVVLAALFVLAEYEASEPIMPLRLFKDSIFNMAGLIGMIIGVAMFGAIGYIPTFLQTVDGASATGSGLLMLPFVAGMLVSSISSGRIITATGKYKIFPILGTGIAAIGMGLLSLMDVDSTRVENGIYMAVLGLGIGLVMQVLVLVVQNSAPARDMGAATASANYFRQIGASVGASIVGALFTHRLSDHLAADMPKGAAGHVKIPPVNSITPEMLRSLPGPIRRAFVNAFAEALPPIFLYLVPLIVVAFILSWFLKQKPLRSRGAPAEPGGAAGPPALEPPVSAGARALPAAPNGAAAPADPVADLFSDYMAGRASPPPAPAALRGAEPPGAYEPGPEAYEPGAPAAYEPGPPAAYDPGLAGRGELPVAYGPGPGGYSGAPVSFDAGPPVPYESGAVGNGGAAYDRDFTISGWVTLGGGTPAQAALTLVDAGGRQVDAGLTGNGRYQLTAPEPGRYLLVCSPIGGLVDAGYRPTATYITVGDGISEFPIDLTR
ncbi:MAG TPA: MFS transporter [Streptosporangiaceae bacterium]